MRLALVVWIGATLLLALHAARFDFVCDDAFISFRYAENVVLRGELVWNPGERVEGYSNFLWTVLLAGVIRGGGDPVWWSRALGVAASAGTLAVVLSFALSWSGGFRGRHLAAPLLLAGCPAFAAWSVGGLETALFTLLVSAGLFRHLLEQRDGGRPLSGLLLGLAALTRPEGILAAGVLGLRDLALHRRAPRPALHRVGAFLLVFLPWWTWRTAYYDAWVPNTWVAKGTSIGMWTFGVGEIWRFLVALGAGVALLLLVPLARRGGGDRALAGAVALLSGAWLLHVFRAGGDFMVLNRLLVPLLPALAVVAQEGVAALGARGSRLTHGAGVAVATLLLGSRWAAIETDALRTRSVDGIDHIGSLRKLAEEHRRLGELFASMFPPDTTIATTAAGALPWASRLPALDLLGLTDAEVARLPARNPRPGHARHAPIELVVARLPDVYLGSATIAPEPGSAPPPDDIYLEPHGYQWLEVPIPWGNPRYLGFWTRRDPETLPERDDPRIPPGAKPSSVRSRRGLSDHPPRVRPGAHPAGGTR